MKAKSLARGGGVRRLLNGPAADGVSRRSRRHPLDVNRRLLVQASACVCDTFLRRSESRLNGVVSRFFEVSAVVCVRLPSTESLLWMNGIFFSFLLFLHSSLDHCRLLYAVIVTWCGCVCFERPVSRCAQAIRSIPLRQSRSLLLSLVGSKSEHGWVGGSLKVRSARSKHACACVVLFAAYRPLVHVFTPFNTRPGVCWLVSRSAPFVAECCGRGRGISRVGRGNERSLDLVVTDGQRRRTQRPLSAFVADGTFSEKGWKSSNQC